MASAAPPSPARRKWKSLSGSSEAPLLPQGRLAGPMPWVIAIMIALTVVAVASGLSLRNAASAASADLEGGLTVQVVNAAPAERNRQAAAAGEVLRRTAGVADVRPVAQDELNRLVEPWLGTRPGDDIDALPIPALIDVKLSGPATPERIEVVRKAIKAAAPSARVDAQSAWLAPVFGAIASLQWLALGLVALLGFAASAAVLLAARTALGTNRGTIEIVHLLGATDRQIARIFQRSIMIDAAAGGAAGLALGLAAILVLGQQFAALGSGLVSAGGLDWSDWAIVAAIPFAGVALAMLTARITVLRALGQML
jgi:cell division transport system permease protein